MTWSKVVQDQKSDWCPILIPILVLIISIYLVIAPIVDNPQIEYLYSILFMVFGAIMYVPFVHFGYVFEFMDKLTTFLQLMLQIAPPCGLPVVYLWSTCGLLLTNQIKGKNKWLKFSSYTWNLRFRSGCIAIFSRD